MKTIIIFLILITSTTAFSEEQMDWNAPDKKKHMEISAVIGGALETARLNHSSKLNEIHIFALAMLPGLAKEATDPTWSNNDIKADAVGVMLGIITAKYLTWRF